MKRTLFLISFGIAVFFLAAQSAQAAQCGDRDVVVAHLADRFGEVRQSAGLADPQTLVEVFASEDTGTWTIIVTRAGGPACILAAGVAYQSGALPEADEQT